MSPPRYVFNHICLYDESDDLWRVYHKKDKRIPKTRECYGLGGCIGVGLTIDDAIADACENGNGVYARDIQILKNKVDD